MRASFDDPTSCRTRAWAMCRATGDPAPWLLAGTARPGLDQGQDGDRRQQQPGGEQEMQGKGEDGQDPDDDEDKKDDPGHGDRSPFRQAVFVALSLPWAAAAVDRDQPRFAPWYAPGGIRGIP